MTRSQRTRIPTSPRRLNLFLWALFLALPSFLAPVLGRDLEPGAKSPSDEVTQTFSPAEQAEIRMAVEAVLPPRWFVVKAKTDHSPPDWYSDDPRGSFLVECTNGPEDCRVWFLPPDWVGIRKADNKAARTCYWEGVLGGSKYKTITHCDNDKLQSAMQQLFGHGMSTTSLINSGYYRAEEIFAHRADAADAAAQRLIKAHCTTPRQFAEAAHSLVVLGVPAKTVFLRAAREVEGSEKDFFTGALGLMGGDDAVGVLCDVLADSKAGDHERSYAAKALQMHSDKRIGPALHKALNEMAPVGEPMRMVIRELGRTHYEPAVPDLLRLLRDPNKKCQWPASEALATLRCKEAIPDLRKIVEHNPDKEDEPPTEDGYRMALLRLEGDWGAAGKDRRFMIWLPTEATVGSPIKVSVYEENISAGYVTFSGIDVTEDAFTLDDKRLVQSDRRAFDFLSWQAPPGHVSRQDLDLSEHITKPGRYKIRFGLGDIHSNEATLLLRPAKP